MTEVVRLSNSADLNALNKFLAKYKQGDSYVIDSKTLPDEYQN